MLRVLAFGLILSVSVVHAQLAGDTADTYVTGLTVIGKKGESPSCPLIVWIVKPDSPAARAGINPGDRLLAVDGVHTTDAERVRPLLHTQSPKPSILELVGEKGPYTVTVSRVRSSDLLAKDGLKLAPDGSGEIFPIDASEAEMKRVEKFDGRRIQQNIYPTHYPRDLNLYYAGFEIGILRDPSQVTVAGLENGPARKAGVHWGDVIVSVNGVSPMGKSGTELEDLFSSPHPATMTLVVDRDGEARSYTFELAKAADILRENHRQVYKGHIIPSPMPAEYVHCFETK